MGVARHVLVVDEDRDMREMIVAQLEEAGIKALSAGSFRDALAMLRGGGIAAVLCEVRMRHGDGFDLLDGVRGLSPGVRVILMTSFGDACDAEQARRAGAFDYLVKPFARRSLLGAIQRALA